MNKMQEFCTKCNETYSKLKPGLGRTGEVLGIIGVWLWRLRKIFIAIPVVWCSIYLARLNTTMLPEMVGIGLQNTGEYVRFITREAAVKGPLAVTAGCLLLMFCSRKTLYPWMICMFSLALPLLALITNIFPA